MDPITIAIVAALTAGATSGVTEVAKDAIVDAYQALKGLIRNKFGGKGAIVQSLELLEVRPDSVGRQKTFEEEIIDAQVTQDPEIVQAARSLLDLVQKQPGGERHIQNITGNYNAVVQRRGNATVNVNQLGQPQDQH